MSTRWCPYMKSECARDLCDEGCWAEANPDEAWDAAVDEAEWGEDDESAVDDDWLFDEPEGEAR